MIDIISISPFELRPRGPLNAYASGTTPRPGFILHRNGGYASIFPWPEFGDPTCSELLIQLRNRNLDSELLRNAFHFSEIDAEARKNSYSLFKDLPIPRSHQLITAPSLFEDETGQASKDTIYKLKLHGVIEKDILLIETVSDHAKRLRLDANASYSLEAFVQLWNRLDKSAKDKVQFVEDPIPYRPEDWKTLSMKYDIPLAYDFYSSEFVGDYYKVRIIKPLVQQYQVLAAQEIERGRKIVVTNTLDHAFGVSIAAWVSGTLSAKYPLSILDGGYTSFTAYHSDPFFEAIQDKKKDFHHASGTGFGFDALLSELSWEVLS